MVTKKGVFVSSMILVLLLLSSTITADQSHKNTQDMLLIGQRVNTLYSGNEVSQVLRWDGTDEDGNRLPAGVYFYRLFLDGENLETKRMILLQ